MENWTLAAPDRGKVPLILVFLRPCVFLAPEARWSLTQKSDYIVCSSKIYALNTGE